MNIRDLQASLTYPATSGTESRAEALIASKHQEYTKLASSYKRLYYVTRLVAGLAAGLLAFVVHTQPSLATVLALTVVVTTVIDSVFSPKENWTLYSKATSYLTLYRIRLEGEYDKYQDILDLLVQTEESALKLVISVHQLVEEVQKADPRNPSEDIKRGP